MAEQPQGRSARGNHLRTPCPVVAVVAVAEGLMEAVQWNWGFADVGIAGVKPQPRAAVCTLHRDSVGGALAEKGREERDGEDFSTWPEARIRGKKRVVRNPDA